MQLSGCAKEDFSETEDWFKRDGGFEREEREGKRMRGWGGVREDGE